MNSLRLVLMFFSIIYMQVPDSYNLENVNDNYLLRNGRDLSDNLLSKSIVDLRLIENSSIAVGTSGGIGLIENGINFYSYNDDNIVTGGNPALETYSNENLIILSGVEINCL